MTSGLIQIDRLLKASQTYWCSIHSNSPKYTTEVKDKLRKAQRELSPIVSSPEPQIRLIAFLKDLNFSVRPQSSSIIHFYRVTASVGPGPRHPTDGSRVVFQVTSDQEATITIIESITCGAPRRNTPAGCRQ